MATEKQTASKPSIEKDRVSASGSEEIEKVDFGGESQLPPPPTLTKDEESKLWRKVDWHLMPILSLMYLLSFLDRGTCMLIRTRLESRQTV